MIQPFSARMPIGTGRGRTAYDLALLQETDRGQQSRRTRRLRKLAERQMLLSGRHHVTTLNLAYGTYTAMTVTNLQSLANDATDPFAGWQSDRVDNQTSVKAVDFEILVDLSTANTAPANDSSAYVYVVPWVTTDGGSTWVAAGNFGTTTLPTGSEGTASMSDPNSMKGPVTIPYKIAQQRLDVFFTIGQMCGGVVPDAWSLAIRNCTGAALSTGCVVAYRAITYTNT